MLYTLFFPHRADRGSRSHMHLRPPFRALNLQNWRIGRWT